jgi:hypothetical protein
MKTIYELDDCDFECALYDYLVVQEKKVESMAIKVSIDGVNFVDGSKATILIITEDE